MTVYKLYTYQTADGEAEHDAEPVLSWSGYLPRLSGTRARANTAAWTLVNGHSALVFECIKQGTRPPPVICCWELVQVNADYSNGSVVESHGAHR